MFKILLLILSVSLISCTSKQQKCDCNKGEREISSKNKILHSDLININFLKLEQILKKRLNATNRVTIDVFTHNLKFAPYIAPGVLIHSILFQKDDSEDFYCTFVSAREDSTSNLLDCDLNNKWPELYKPINNSDIELVFK